jgi:hypothetical protein
MILPTNHWRERRTEHSCYAEIVKDIITWNYERKDTEWDNIKKLKDERHGPHQKTGILIMLLLREALAQRSLSNDWLVRNNDKMSEWRDMS